MRSPLAVCALALTLAFAPDAQASPAMPRPLETKVEDADLVVVASVRTRPAHPGDAFEVAVLETLKGRAPGSTLSAKAAYFFTGCLVSEVPPPPPPSIEGRAVRLILFLDKDGQSSDPILLDPDEGVSAWCGEGRPAAGAVAAIRALVALDAEPDDARAAVLWEKGLAADEPLLASCLLHRIGLAATSTKEQPGELGPRVAPLARAQLVATRGRLWPHLTRFVGSDEMPRRREALWQAYSCLYQGLVEDGPDREALIAAVRGAGKSTNADTRDVAVRCLVAARDPEGAERFLAALRKRPLDRAQVAVVANLGRVLLLRSYPDRERDFLAATAALLDDPGAEDVGVATLTMLTGEQRGKADAWREWWRKREGK